MSDRVTVRLGAYLALLVVIFCIAWVVGQWVGPLGSDEAPRSAHAGSEHTSEGNS